MGCSLFFLLSILYSVFITSPAIPITNVETLTFDEGYTQLFGDTNLMVLKDGQSVHLSLDERTGLCSGFVSQDLYLHGFFSASIKLPSDYTAGVVVAFYMSNGDMFEKTHDELDFEFLGNIRGKEWRIQTNVYGNGSTAIGREERYGLWFDPTEDFHRYSILWTDQHIVFYVDDTPIREMVRNKAMGGDYPSKPMSLYATIWDGSTWATAGGRYKINYKYAPYIAEFSNLVLHGCAVDPIERSPTCRDRESYTALSSPMTPDQRAAMGEFRRGYMTYSYCYDRVRYPVPPAECPVDHRGANRLRGGGSERFGAVRGQRHGKRRPHRRAPVGTGDVEM
ncbi:putative xyloglucan endotransglucosylase/hydrolase protein 27 [Acorus calamus]|uniref:Xyloglucan endotransglucosylase/hydrolase n=1 Tax=Acorus calamus TaxID=4465 RepID=A0AAV9DL72_ACOCL|nr:putative xyloglucan endotransglucosylase/hydrolase protein 27 [Acorus calamus]